ncbi:hypothetical protein PRUPE_8G205800 [Prunus persica]|uniref:Uncharacterized protein n=1 Tax=Prunus persica TaxID=3760 RepID=A0A251N421_PRUPE|nr:hypothetical protein PRUPE_8G205800 [Prunus persica]
MNQQQKILLITDLLLGGITVAVAVAVVFGLELHGLVSLLSTISSVLWHWSSSPFENFRFNAFPAPEFAIATISLFY